MSVDRPRDHPLEEVWKGGEGGANETAMAEAVRVPALAENPP